MDESAAPGETGQNDFDGSYRPFDLLELSETDENPILLASHAHECASASPVTEFRLRLSAEFRSFGVPAVSVAPHAALGNRPPHCNTMSP